MSFTKRLEKKIDLKEKQIEKEKHEIDNLKEKLDSGKITRAAYNIKKNKIEEKIKTLNARMRVLQGLHTKERRHQEEIAEKKKKKKEEKEKKKKS